MAATAPPKRIAIIGGGNIGLAIADGLLKGLIKSWSFAAKLTLFKFIILNHRGDFI